MIVWHLSDKITFELPTSSVRRGERNYGLNYVRNRKKIVRVFRGI